MAIPAWIPDSFPMWISAHPRWRAGRRISGARSALAVSAVVLLNLVLQPCALALESGGQCPNCPPATDHSVTAHHGGANPSAGLDIACATSGFDCMLVGDYSHDGRDGHFKAKDAPDNPSPAVIQTGLALPNPARSMLQNFDRYSLAVPGAAPPLHVLYCVYLK